MVGRSAVILPARSPRGNRTSSAVAPGLPSARPNWVRSARRLASFGCRDWVRSGRQTFRKIGFVPSRCLVRALRANSPRLASSRSQMPNRPQELPRARAVVADRSDDLTSRSVHDRGPSKGWKTNPIAAQWPEKTNPIGCIGGFPGRLEFDDALSQSPRPLEKTNSHGPQAGHPTP
jgi:hypothetical protein